MMIYACSPIKIEAYRTFTGGVWVDAINPEEWIFKENGELVYKVFLTTYKRKWRIEETERNGKKVAFLVISDSNDIFIDTYTFFFQTPDTLSLKSPLFKDVLLYRER